MAGWPLARALPEGEDSAPAQRSLPPGFISPVPEAAPGVADDGGCLLWVPLASELVWPLDLLAPVLRDCVPLGRILATGGVDVKKVISPSMSCCYVLWLFLGRFAGACSGQVSTASQ
eukprot:GHVR01079704.1.p4 GENE.GHVR01079704.1~~GHVR01079704.1.p4  ORF type:complete len:117 (+),score=26.95 GHVR01079704.1:559-909(+)